MAGRGWGVLPHMAHTALRVCTIRTGLAHAVGKLADTARQDSPAGGR